MYNRHVTSDRFTGKFPPKMKKVISESTKWSRHCIVQRCGEYEFQVDQNEFIGRVKLDSNYCECEMWQLSGIPCHHVVTCITTVRGHIEDYVDVYFSTDKGKACYARVIHPIPSQNLWPPMDNCDLQPPIARPLSGRPKKRCRRAEGELEPPRHAQSRTKRCSICNKFGHNRRSCTDAANTTRPGADGRTHGRVSDRHGVRAGGRTRGRVGGMDRGIIRGRGDGVATKVMLIIEIQILIMNMVN